MKVDRLHTLVHLQNIARYPKRYALELDSAFQDARRGRNRSRSRSNKLSTEFDSARISNQGDDESELLSRNSIVVPPRYSPQAPLIPRVGKKVTKIEPTPAPPPRKRLGPLVPRVAFLAKQKQNENHARTASYTQHQALNQIYNPKNLNPGFEFVDNDSFPGDEELFIPTDTWAWTPLGIELVRQNQAKPKSYSLKDGGFSISPKHSRGALSRSHFVTRELAEKALICGSAFSSSFRFRETKRHLCRIHVTCVDGQFVDLRRHFIDHVWIELRRLFMRFGIEFQWNDLQLEQPVIPDDFRKRYEIERWSLESSLKDSALFNQIALFSANEYGDFAVPIEMEAAVFDQLLLQIQYMKVPHTAVFPAGLTASQLMEAWYLLEENCVPGKRVLRKCSEVVPELKTVAVDDSQREQLIRAWMTPLVTVLKAAAVQLGRNAILLPSSVQKCVQSHFQEQILRGIVTQSRHGLWGKSLLIVENLPVADSALSEQETRSSNQSNDKKQRHSSKLGGYLDEAVPSCNRIETKTLPTALNAVEELANSLSDIIESGLDEWAATQHEYNALTEEIGVHCKEFKKRAKDHGLREHLVEKVVSYIATVDSHPLPPMLILGEAGMGKTSLLGKSLQKYVQKLTEAASFHKKTDLSASSALISGTASAVSLNSNATTLTTATSATSQRPRSAGSSAAERSKSIPIVQPVIVARIAGLTPESSCVSSLIKSMTHQITAAFNIPSHALGLHVTLDMFRAYLHLATSERPIVISLSKPEKLNRFLGAPKFSLLSWIVDYIPPFVRVVISTNDSELTTFISERIQAEAPAVLLSRVKHGPPPNPIELQNSPETYLVKVGELIAPVLKSLLKRKNDALDRSLTIEQEEALRRAFLDSTPVKGVVPVRMLSLLHSISLRWTHETPVTECTFPKSIREALSSELARLEGIHGEPLVRLFFSLLATSQQGLTQSEILDLLLLNTSGIVKSDEGTIIVLPLMELMHDVKNYINSRNAWGGELLQIVDDPLLEVVQARYLPTAEVQSDTAKWIAYYFLEVHAPFPLLMQMPWKTEETGGLGIVWNARKMAELPSALIKAGMTEELNELFSTMDFLEGLMITQGPKLAQETIHKLLCESRAQIRFQDNVIALMESAHDFFLCNRDIFQQTPNHLHHSAWNEQISRLPDSHIMKNTKRREPALSNGILSVLQPWSIVSDTSTNSGITNQPPPTDVDSEFELPIKKNLFLTKRQGKLSIKTAPIIKEKETRTIHHSRPSITLFHQNHHFLAASPNGQYLASGASDGKVQILDACTFTHVATFQANGRITGLHFEPSDRKLECTALLISYSEAASTHRLVRWCIKREAVTSTIAGKKNGLRYALISSGFLSDPQGNKSRRAFGLSLNSTLAIWDLESRQMLKSIPPNLEDDCMLMSGRAAVSEEGEFVVFGIRGLRVLQARSLTVVWAQKIHAEDPMFELHGVSHLCFRRDGTRIIVVSDKGVQMNKPGDGSTAGGADETEWRTAVQQITVGSSGQDSVPKMWMADECIHSLALLEDQNSIAVGGTAGVVEVIRLDDGAFMGAQPLMHSVACLLQLPEREASESTATSSDGSNKCYKLIASSVDGMIQVLGFKNQAELPRKTDISIARCTPDGSALVLVGGMQKDVHYNDVNAASTESSSMLTQSSVKRRSNEEGISRTPSLETMSAMIFRARSGINEDDPIPVSVKLLNQDARTETGKVIALRRTSITSMKRINSAGNLSMASTSRKSIKSVTFATLPETRATPDTEITVWNVEMGHRLIKIPIRADILWCDFESSSQGVQTLLTGERNGIIRIWDWLIIAAAADSSPSNEISYVELNVREAGDEKVVVGYALHPTSAILAVASSVGISAAEKGFLRSSTSGSRGGATAASTTTVELWNFKTAERLKNIEIHLSALPSSAFGASPLMGMSWSQQSDTLFDMFPSDGPLRNRSIPANLVIGNGAEKLVIAADRNPVSCIVMHDFLQEKLGAEALQSQCTASHQSHFDPRVLILGMGDVVYWILHEYSRDPGSLSSMEDAAANEEAVDIQANNPEDGDVNGVEESPVNCRIRKILCPVGESVIALHHLKSVSVDAILIATDFGTLAVYDISLPKHYFRAQGSDVVNEPASLVAIWHAKVPLSGMHVVDTEAPQTIQELKRKCSWRVVVWGRGGFTSILDLDL
ncbi:NACHT domain- and WD repeat-containing protein 1 [Chytriomyces hyalinus]|nr:NACHT domain- and WD repeat-containing protein 1 [Chytriomyces hyalinus]